MLQSPLKRDGTRRVVQGKATAGRGEAIASFEAKYHGSVPVEEARGNEVVMEAVNRVHALKLKPQAVTVTVTDKGVYVDDKATQTVIKKVPIGNLSWACGDPRNKKLFSFVSHEPRLNRKDCFTFSMKKGKAFVVACNKAIADLVSAGSRAEAEAMLIAAATPIMPVVYDLPEDEGDGNGSLMAGDDAYELEGKYGYGDRDDGIYSSIAYRGPAGGDKLIFADNDLWVDDSYLTHALGIFRAQYLGGIPVKEIEGFRVVQQAALRVKDYGLPPKDVSLVITEAQVILVERETGDHLQETPISLVSYSLLDPRDKKHFYYIVNDPRLGCGYCHVLRCLTPPDLIPKCVAAALREAAHQRALEAKENQMLGQLNRGKSKKEKSNPPLGVYELKYLGAVRVSNDKGNHVVKKAMDDLKNKFTQVLELGPQDDWTAIGDRVVLVVTTDGLRVVDMTSGEIVHFTFITEITFSTHLHSGVNRKENPEHDIFGYIARDEKVSRTVCHVFKCPPGVARDITKTVGFTFRLAVDEMQRSEKDNPFQPQSKTDFDLSSLFPKHLLLNRRDVKAIKVLGAGQFGTVWLALHRQVDKSSEKGFTESYRAVKLLRNGSGDQDQEDFLREALTMSKMEHNNLVQLVGVSVNHMPWLVVQEFMKYGDLRNVLTACREKQIMLSEAEHLRCMQQVADGMAYLSDQRLVHMDLALRNVLLGVDNIVKVSDFGLTRPFDKGRDYYKLKPNVTVKLPAKWMAPECLDSLVFSEASDVWAFGVVMWEMITYGGNPYPEHKNKEMRRVIKSGVRLKLPQAFPCSDELYGIMSSCWETSPKKRPNFKKLSAKIKERHIQVAETVETGSSKPRDIGLLVNDGVDKELPRERQTVVDMYSSYTARSGPGGEGYLDVGDSADASYLDIGNPNAAYDASKAGADGSYLDIGNPYAQQDSSYLDVVQGQDGAGNYLETVGPDAGNYLQTVGPDSSNYLDVQQEDDDDSSYIKIQQEISGGATGLSDISRTNPLFGDADNYIDVANNAEGSSYLEFGGAAAGGLGDFGNPDAEASTKKSDTKKKHKKEKKKKK